MNNPPVFPIEKHLRTDFSIAEQLGMALRDYFAAKAMQSILVGIECGPNDVKNVVESAYVLADAMLKAREQ